MRDVALEQLAQLRRGLLRGLDELCVVVLNLVLRFQLRQIVVTEEVHGALSGRDAEAESQQRLVRDVEARGESLAVDDAYAKVAQAEIVDAVARAGKDFHV